MKCTIDNCTEPAITKVVDTEACYCMGHALEQISIRLKQSIDEQNKINQTLYQMNRSTKWRHGILGGAIAFVLAWVAAAGAGAIVGLIVVGYRWTLELSPAAVPEVLLPAAVPEVLP